MAPLTPTGRDTTGMVVERGDDCGVIEKTNLPGRVLSYGVKRIAASVFFYIGSYSYILSTYLMHVGPKVFVSSEGLEANHATVRVVGFLKHGR